MFFKLKQSIALTISYIHVFINYILVPAGMRVVQEIIPTTVIEQQPQEQLITVYETEIHDQHHDTLEVVVPEELLETPSKKKRKEEIGMS